MYLLIAQFVETPEGARFLDFFNFPASEPQQQPAAAPSPPPQYVHQVPAQAPMLYNSAELEMPMSYEKAKIFVRGGVPVEQFRMLPLPSFNNTTHGCISARACMKTLRILHARFFPHIPLATAFDFMWASQPDVCVAIRENGSRCCTLSKANSFFCGHHTKSALPTSFEKCVSEMVEGIYPRHEGESPCEDSM